MKLELQETTGPLPTSTYILMSDDGVALGLLQLRHKAHAGQNTPKSMASHIYYEINPEHQGKGYGKEILKLGLEEARKIGLHEVFLSVDESNPASRAIIVANGGVLVDEAFAPRLNERIFKYRIALDN